MKINPCSFRIWSLLLLGQGCSSFLLHNSYSQNTVWLKAVNDDSATTENKAMSFLKKIGKVGGAANKDFALAVGIDEGGGKSSASGSVRMNTLFAALSYSSFSNFLDIHRV